MDYQLYYWPIPFRGNFIRCLLQYRQVDYQEFTVEEIIQLKDQPITQQPIAFMGSPVLCDSINNFYLSQMPAIVNYLAVQLKLINHCQQQQALASKFILDCNDFLTDLSNHNGGQMWQPAAWQVYISQRLPRWLEIIDRNYWEYKLLAGDSIDVVDLNLCALLATIHYCLPSFGEIIATYQGKLMEHAVTLAKEPSLSAMFKQQQSGWGDIYCGGEIEASIRAML